MLYYIYIIYISTCFNQHPRWASISAAGRCSIEVHGPWLGPGGQCIQRWKCSCPAFGPLEHGFSAKSMLHLRPGSAEIKELFITVLVFPPHAILWLFSIFWHHLSWENDRTTGLFGAKQFDKSTWNICLDSWVSCALLNATLRKAKEYPKTKRSMSWVRCFYLLCWLLCETTSSASSAVELAPGRSAGWSVSSWVSHFWWSCRYRWVSCESAVSQVNSPQLKRWWFPHMSLSTFLYSTCLFWWLFYILIYFDYIFSRHCFAAFHCLHRQIPGWRPSSSRVTWFVNG